ncbi:MAG: hypothetical protein JWP35_2431 [Caulobacter sp.]|nr:hypothetical protein [Caulobacter sp.]
MGTFADDIYTEPPTDPDTLANLGPLRPLAGVWEGVKGLDVKPKADGPKSQAYVERIELQPIDGQTNGPQLLYGLRYHTFITKPGLTKAYHDQIGYWLWEPATGLILHTLAIPRGQTALAQGFAAADATTFEVSSERGTTQNGICSTAFLEHAFRTDSFKMKVTVNADGTWSYFEDTVLQIKGRDEPFHHTDRNTLTKIAEPGLNPLALMAAG